MIWCSVHFLPTLSCSQLFHVKDKKKKANFSTTSRWYALLCFWRGKANSNRVAITSVSYPQKMRASDKSKLRLLVLSIKGNRTQVQIFRVLSQWNHNAEGLDSYTLPLLSSLEAERPLWGLTVTAWSREVRMETPVFGVPWGCEEINSSLALLIITIEYGNKAKWCFSCPWLLQALCM